MKKIIKILAFILILSSGCIEKRTSNTETEEKLSDLRENVQTEFDCYNKILKLNLKDSTFSDTSFILRNYNLQDSNKRIICNYEFVDLNIEKLIWDCQYIETYMDWVERLDKNKIAILSYYKVSESNVVARFYISDLQDLKTVEMRRFLISENKIIGINNFPTFNKEFIPIEEYDNLVPIK